MRTNTHLKTTVAVIDRFILDYYDLNSPTELTAEGFILEPEELLFTGGQLLVRDIGESLEVGIQFGTELMRRFTSPVGIGFHEIGVVSEEVSHLRAILDAAEYGSTISVLDLEVLGEVDRFLTGLHAPELFSDFGGRGADHFIALSLSELCDRQFECRQFECAPALTELYIQAESLALKHLQAAFAHCWEDSRIDRQRCDPRARDYLTELRRGIVTSGRSVRLFPESA